MMDIAKLATDYKAVVTALRSDTTKWPIANQMPTMDPVVVRVKMQEFNSLAQVNKAIAGAESTCEGWVRRQSAVTICPTHRLMVANDGSEGGAPLAGEWALSASQSQQLVYDGQHWRLWTYEESKYVGKNTTPSELTADDHTVETYLRQNQGLLFASEFFPTGCIVPIELTAGLDKLRYAVYWGEPQAHEVTQKNSGVLAPGIERRFSRFIGFTARKD